MEKKEHNGELQSRREFFKKAGSRLLPMLGAIVAGPSIIATTLTSCGGCDDCEAACQDDCSSSCTWGCDGENYTSSSCSDCSAVCSSSCGVSCVGTAEGKPTTGSINGHEYVDLGLSVLWATCNIEANNPSSLGKQFPFVLEDKYDEYEPESWYKEFLSLNLKPDSTISGTYLDIAKKKWGSGWRLPTKDEISELQDACKVETALNVGVKLISKINGAEMILPIDKSSSNYNYMWGGDTTTIDSYFSREDKNEYLGAYTLVAGDIGGEYGQSIERVVFPTGQTYKPSFSIYTDYYIWLQYIRPVADRSNGNVSTCNGNCTARCSSDCTSTCKNECKGECSGNCGKDCTSGCKNGCKDGCYTACTKTCADSCKGQTSQYCSNCASNCSSGCTTTCADACKAQTSQSGGCTGCSGTCIGDCYRSCGGRCDSACHDGCNTQCSYTSRAACSGCLSKCQNGCSNSCNYYCYHQSKT